MWPAISRPILALVLAAALSWPDRAVSAVPDVSSKRTHTLALDVDGNVYAWGSDSDGQLGLGRVLY